LYILHNLSRGIDGFEVQLRCHLGDERRSRRYMQLVIEIIELKSRMYREICSNSRSNFSLFVSICTMLNILASSDRVHRNYHRKIESELFFPSDFLTEYECSFCRPTSDKSRSYRYHITPEYIAVLIQKFLLTNVT
jgi:hypothetical protein